jgi:hypothetical protein
MVYGDFVQEPRAQAYKCLIAVLATMAHRVLLVERDFMTDPGKRFCSQLEAWCVSASRRSEWPGTQLMGGETAVVREFSPSSEVVSSLQTTVDGLYEWLGGLPEDLAFLREDGEAMMVAISHENDASIALRPAERDRLLRECPGIADCIDWASDRVSVTAAMDLYNLHDATLVRVVLLWGKYAQAELHFRLDSQTVTLKASGVTNLTCPHECSWGHSASVNELRGPVDLQEGVRRIEIEMQSGDTILVDAKSFKWEPDK